MVHTLRSFHFARVCSNVSDFNNRNQYLTAELLIKVKDIMQFVKHFYNSSTDTQNNIDLKTLHQQGILSPVFYGDLVI